MPNHCENDLKVNGNRKLIDQMLNEMRGEDDLWLDHNKIIPYPKRFREADMRAEVWRKANSGKPWSEGPQDGYNNGGYEWCVKHWGTKWGFYNFWNHKTGKTFTQISFMTAWSPPLPLIVELSRKYPDLYFTLRYYEAGCAFKGHLRCYMGQVISHETSDYKGGRGG